MNKKGDEKKDFSQCNFSRKNNRGQANISFGMIFSIILIIIFLVFGFYAIKKLVELQQTIQIETFLEDFQNDVDKMWKSVQGSQEVEYTLPTKATAVCFQNDEFQNLKFVSENPISGKQINNLDILNTIKDKSSLCIENTKGKIKMRITKNYGETLVTVSE
jgi:hypothetical protein